MNFDEMILEAAKSIANATSHLIKAASEAQKELVQQATVLFINVPFSLLNSSEKKDIKLRTELLA